MAKMMVQVGSESVKVAGVNAAYNLAGERAKALRLTAPLGTTIVVCRDGAPVLTRTLAEWTACGEPVRDWRLS